MLCCVLFFFFFFFTSSSSSFSFFSFFCLSFCFLAQSLSGKTAPTAGTAKVAYVPPFNTQVVVMHHQGGRAACGVHSRAVLTARVSSRACRPGASHRERGTGRVSSKCVSLLYRTVVASVSWERMRVCGGVYNVFISTTFTLSVEIGKYVKSLAFSKKRNLKKKRKTV